ncbi:MAG TPA: HAMP domain-containing sensor histidine kinase [Thermotogota bacterium]|nr:HAMP domain-containing sensor histidine kinase [Thermotogota bacterium]HRW93341.1 HAMP domain-containing sensor histidine kinase [Thermotogota bacterium]
MSIRWKLFGFTALLIALFLFVAIIGNLFWIQGYYMARKKGELLDASKHFVGLLQPSNSASDVTTLQVDLEIERLMRTTGMHVVVYDTEKKEYLFPSAWGFSPEASGTPTQRVGVPPETEGNVQPPPGLAPPRGQPMVPREVVEGNLTEARFVDQVFDPRINMDVLSLVQPLEGSRVLVISVPLPAIHEEARLAGNYFLFLGLAMLAIGIPLAFFFSRRFTRPILELNTLAGHIARLDFSHTYQGKRSDEIGVLGESINTLSNELRQAMDRLILANQVLERDVENRKKIDNMRKNFISHVSHELKAPLTLIMGHAQGLIQNVAKDAQKRNRYATIILEESRKMDQLVRSVLDLSQMESGLFQVKPRVFSLEELLLSTLEKFAPFFKEKGVSPHVEGLGEQGKAWMVWGDPFRIEQVLSNLFTNAIQNMGEKKRLEVSVVPSPGEGQENRVRVEVFNSGRPKGREDASVRGAEFPEGIGLSIVKGIIRAHGTDGGVRVLHDPEDPGNDGVCFWFELEKAGE